MKILKILGVVVLVLVAVGARSPSEPAPTRWGPSRVAN